MTTTISVIDLRRRLEDALLRARAELANGERFLGREADRVADTRRLLELLLEGAGAPIAGVVYDDAIGYGSLVAIEDLDTGEWFEHRLMSAEAMDLDAGHVTIDSPLGNALLGRKAGDVIDFQMPNGRRRRVFVASVETLPSMLERLDAEPQTLDAEPRAETHVRARDRRRAPARTGTHG